MDGGASAEAVGRAGDFLAATDAEVVWRTDGFNAGELREQPGGLPGEVVQGLQVAEYLVFGGAAEFLQPAPAFLDGLFGFIYLKKTLGAAFAAYQGAVGFGQRSCLYNGMGLPGGNDGRGSCRDCGCQY